MASHISPFGLRWRHSKLSNSPTDSGLISLLRRNSGVRSIVLCGRCHIRRRLTDYFFGRGVTKDFCSRHICIDEGRSKLRVDDNHGATGLLNKVL